MEDTRGCRRTIVVHYSRYWLPPPVSSEEEPPTSADCSRVVEVILEPQVLWLCLLRKAANFKLTMAPEVYDRYAGGPLPAAFVEHDSCLGGEPLRQAALLEYLFLNLPKSLLTKGHLLQSRFLHYDCSEHPDHSAERKRNKALVASNVLPAYVEKHLRHALMYLIWVYPLISHNVTKRIVTNSMPWPHGHIAYYRKAAEMAKECSQLGYTSIEFTVKEIKLMLSGLQVSLQRRGAGFNHRPGYWLEGSVFANLCVLFSIPCHGIEELLAVHREFYDLKAYCIMVNRTYKVADLMPPFLCGNTFPISYFVKGPCSMWETLSGLWDKAKDSQILRFMCQHNNAYHF